MHIETLVGKEIYIKDTRFWDALVLTAAGCWEAPFHRTHGRHALVKRRGMDILAHRYAFSLVHGGLLLTDLICHKCDNPICCNLSHLFKGTKEDNRRDCILKGRAKQVFTKETIVELRDLYATGKYTMRELAAWYDVSSSSISDIINNKAWWYV